ncbi:MAG: HEAT repeat domain-containing protein [bacterium]
MIRVILLLGCLIGPCLLVGKETRPVVQDKGDRVLYIQDLKYAVPQKRWEAAEILGNAGDIFAVPYLINALKDGVVKVRENSCEALGKLGDRRAVTPLIERLKDSYPSVRYAAGEALARLHDGSGVSIIVQAIRDTTVPFERRAGIAEALGILGEKQAIPVLVAVLNDPASPKLRENVITALGVLKAEAAVRALTNRLKSDVESSPQCRVAITQSLLEIGDKPGSIGPLIRALKDPDVVVRKGASDALGKFIYKDRATIPILIDFLEPEDTREYAAMMLDSFFNNQDEIDLLAKVVGATGDSKKPARLYAIQRLEKIKDPGSVRCLIEALNDPDSIVRAKASTALGVIKSPLAIPPLIKFVNDTSLIVARDVVVALGEIGDPLCDTTLFQIISDKNKDWGLRTLAAQSIGELPFKKVFDRLLMGLRDKNADIRYLSVVSLDELGRKEALSSLDYTAKNDSDKETRNAARLAVGRLRGKSSNRSY